MGFGEAMFFLAGSALAVVACGPALAWVLRVLLAVVAVLAVPSIALASLMGWIDSQSCFGWVAGVVFGSFCAVVLHALLKIKTAAQWIETKFSATVGQKQ